MTHYRLHDDLSFCQVDGHLVFLDVGRDRYFRLSERMERTLLAYLESGESPGLDIRMLVEHDILAPSALPTKHEPVPTIPVPTRSALEEAPRKTKCQVATLVHVCATLCWTRWQLKTRRLKTTLGALELIWHREALEHATDPNESLERRAADTARTFLQARIYAPVETSCLLDSLALVKFLARQGLRAHIVFGVTGDPFSAHCWVQVKDMVLSDTAGNVNAYTPIRVV